MNCTIDASVFVAAVQITTAYRLRGADSIYVAVAESFDAALITWDAEMLQRGAAVVQAFTPTEWMERRQGREVVQDA